MTLTLSGHTSLIFPIFHSPTHIYILKFQVECMTSRANLFILFLFFLYFRYILLILRTDVLKLKKEGIHRHCWQIWQEHTTYLYQQSVDLEVGQFTILYCHNNSRTDYLQDHFTFSVIFKFNTKNIKSFIDRWTVMKYVDERAP